MPYKYSIHDITLELIPFTKYDEYLLNNLNSTMDNRLYCDYIDVPYKNVIVMSGGNNDILYDRDIDISLLIKINKIWNDLHIDYKAKINDWKDIIENNLILLDNNAGMYKIKNTKDQYIVLTDIAALFEQSYKILLSVEYLTTYLFSLEKKIFFHSSCAGFRQNDCFLFIGKSGYGKSTIAELFSKHDGYVINDEKNLVYEQNHEYSVFSGQPNGYCKYNDLHRIEHGICKKLFFLHKSDKNFIEKIDKNENKEDIVDYITRINMEIGGCPINFPILNKNIIRCFINDLVDRIHIYNLYFSLDCNIQDIFLKV